MCVCVRRTTGLTDLQHESPEIERVIIHHHPSNIPDDGVDGAQEHTPREPPLFPPEAEIEMDGDGQGVQCDQADIGG